MLSSARKFIDEKAAVILERFLASPAGAALLTQAGQEPDVDRAALAAQLAEIIDKQTAAHARSVADIAPLKAMVDALTAELEAARVALGAREFAYSLEARALYDQNERTRCALRDSAPEAIAAFQSEMDAEVQRTWEALQVRSEPTIDGRNVSWSNHESVTARMDAARRARQAAEELRYDVLTDDALAARLQALRDGLPAVEPTPSTPPRSVLQGGR